MPQRSMSELIDAAFTSQGRFFYQAWFQNVGPAEAELEADVRGALRKFYYAISGDAPDGTWPSDKRTARVCLRAWSIPTRFPPG